MSVTDPVAPLASEQRTRSAPPRGTIEHVIRWASTALVLSVGLALLAIPGVAETSPDSNLTDPEFRWVRLSAGAGLILLLIVREMFVWFGSRRP